MSIEEKRREAFEKYCLDEGFSSHELEIVRGEYRASIIRHMWDCWDAALDSLEIDLGVDLLDSSQGAEAQNAGITLGIEFAAERITAAGLKVKV